MQEEVKFSWVEGVFQAVNDTRRDPKYLLKVIIAMFGWSVLWSVPMIVLAILNPNKDNPSSMFNFIISVLMLLTFAGAEPFLIKAALSIKEAGFNIKEWIATVKENYLKFLLGLLIISFVYLLFSIILTLGTIMLIAAMSFLPQILARILGVLLVVGIVCLAVYVVVRVFPLYFIRLLFSDDGPVASLFSVWKMSKGYVLTFLLIILSVVGVGFVAIIILTVLGAMLAAIGGPALGQVLFLIIAGIPIMMLSMVIRIILTNVFYSIYEQLNHQEIPEIEQE